MSGTPCVAAQGVPIPFQEHKPNNLFNICTPTKKRVPQLNTYRPRKNFVRRRHNHPHFPGKVYCLTVIRTNFITNGLTHNTQQNATGMDSL